MPIWRRRPVSAVAGSYKNSGQRCTAVKRILVRQPVAEIVERLVAKTKAWTWGDPMDEAHDMGTLIDAAAAQVCESQVDAAVAAGARLLLGNQRQGALYAPTVLDHVRPEMTVVREETFGPVAPVIRFDTLDEAIGIVNNSPFGLSSGVCIDQSRSDQPSGRRTSSGLRERP